MSEKFKQLKNRICRIRRFKSLSAGVGIGLGVCGGLRLLSAYEIFPLDNWIPILVGILCGAAVWLLFFLLLRASDMRLAKRLDDQFSLDERLQTMLEYREGEGAMLELQREDANRALDAISPRHIKYTHAWLYLLTLAIGTAALTLSLVLGAPEAAPPTPKPDEPYSVEELQLAALEELITSVKASEMASPYRENVVAALEALLEEIPNASTVEQKDALVADAIDAIYLETDRSSAAVELMDALWRNEDAAVKALAQHLNYYAWRAGGEWDKFEETRQKLLSSLLHQDHGENDMADAAMLADIKDRYVLIVTDITTAMAGVGLPTDAPLFLQLTRLASARENNSDGTRLWGLATMASDLASYADVERELEGTLSLLSPEIFRALELHATNTATGEGAMTKLADLFGVPLPQFKRPNLYSAGGSSGGDSMGDGSGGSIGGGDVVYGSNDVVFDPVTGQYVEYGKIIAEYNRLMLGKLQDGKLSEEDKLAIQKYFDILYGGFQDKK